uniref:MHC class I-like antigen recognition-like domain-containing protein n=1 Tax=Accipiter nisus TaxID=211598 RepID=A0A8B9NJ68_9AVES
MRYFHMAVSEPSPGVPQFMDAGYVDGNLISRYDSETGRTVPRADWMADNLDQQHWDGETQIGQRNQQVYRINLDTLRDRYNQSGRAQTRQRMYGCDILEDGSTRGYYQNAYDGRDFIAFDLDTMTFIAADAAAEITKRKWEEDGSEAEQWKHYLKNTCVEWLRKYVSYGQAVLERKGEGETGTLGTGCCACVCRLSPPPPPQSPPWSESAVLWGPPKLGGHGRKKKGYNPPSGEYRRQVRLQLLPSAGVFLRFGFLAAAGISRSPVLPMLPLFKSLGTYGRDRVSSLVLTAPSCSISGCSVAVAPGPAPGTCTVPVASTGLAAHGCFSLTGMDSGVGSSATGMVWDQGGWTGLPHLFVLHCGTRSQSKSGCWRGTPRPPEQQAGDRQVALGDAVSSSHPCRAQRLTAPRGASTRYDVAPCSLTGWTQRGAGGG